MECQSLALNTSVLFQSSLTLASEHVGEKLNPATWKDQSD
jgi:hypothetical protein